MMMTMITGATTKQVKENEKRITKSYRIKLSFSYIKKGIVWYKKTNKQTIENCIKIKTQT